MKVWRALELAEQLHWDGMLAPQNGMLGTPGDAHLIWVPPEVHGEGIRHPGLLLWHISCIDSLIHI